MRAYSILILNLIIFSAMGAGADCEFPMSPRSFKNPGMRPQPSRAVTKVELGYRWLVNDRAALVCTDEGQWGVDENLSLEEKNMVNQDWQCKLVGESYPANKTIPLGSVTIQCVAGKGWQVSTNQGYRADPEGRCPAVEVEPGAPTRPYVEAGDKLLLGDETRLVCKGGLWERDPDFNLSAEERRELMSQVECEFDDSTYRYGHTVPFSLDYSIACTGKGWVVSEEKGYKGPGTMARNLANHHFAQNIAGQNEGDGGKATVPGAKPADHRSAK